MNGMQSETAEFIEAIRPGVQSMPINHEAALTLEQKIALCNAVNTAVAKGHTVKAGKSVIHGMVIRGGTILYLEERFGEKNIMSFRTYSASLRRITIVKPVEIEIDVIYDPPSFPKNEPLERGTLRQSYERAEQMVANGT